MDSYALSEELSTEVETKPSVLLALGVHLDCHVDTADLGAHCVQLLCVAFLYVPGGHAPDGMYPGLASRHAMPSAEA